MSDFNPFGSNQPEVLNDIVDKKNIELKTKVSPGELKTICHAYLLQHIDDDGMDFDNALNNIVKLRNELACSINGDRVNKIIEGLKGMSVTKIDSNAPIGGTGQKR